MQITNDMTTVKFKMGMTANIPTFGPLIQDTASARLIKGISEMVDDSFNYITTTKKSPTENRMILSKELFEAIDYTNMGVVEEPKNLPPTFIVGEKYALRGASCEGFTMPTKVYELVAVHDKFDDIDINSVIVKQISGDNSKIFTLSKNDCLHIGIEYEPGLQLFPKDLKWELVKDVVPFNPHDLSTTPSSSIDNKIRDIVIKMNGFQDYRDGYIITPNNKLIKEGYFKHTLQFTSNEPIGQILDFQMYLNIVQPKGIIFNHGNFISEDNSIYVRLSTRPSLGGLIPRGVNREEVKGFDPNEHFSISWDELGAYTVEEYEELKAKTEKERQERIAKAEALKKKRIEEEERRIKEQKKNKEALIEKMKGIEINTFIDLPRIPKFDVNRNTSSLDLYMNGINVYFESMENGLNNLSKQLDKMSQVIDESTPKREIDILTQSTKNILDEIFPKI